jgi:hypothetical protein
MIKHKVEDTQFPDFKTAVIYYDLDPDMLFVAFNIRNVDKKKPSSSVVVHTSEEFIRAVNEKTGIKISDLVAEGKAPEHKKYISLKLDDNITLLHTEKIRKW